ncbi:ATP-binding protein [Actinocorallia lasiicapitis]
MTMGDLNMNVLASPAAAGMIRTLMRGRIAAWNLSQREDDLLLVASELLTNACEACPGAQLRMRFGRNTTGAIIAVWDPSPEVPKLQQTTSLTCEDIDISPQTWDNGGGWGLHITQALSADCGFTPTTPGKWVWARFTP